MRTLCSLTLLAGLVLAPNIFAQAPKTGDIWENAFIDGNRVGSVHTSTEWTTSKGRKVLRTKSDLVLSFQRYKTKVQLRMEKGSESTAGGKMVSVFMNQYQDNRKGLELVGTVEPTGDRLHVVVDGGRIERRVRWPSGVIGIAQLDSFFVSKKPRAGDSFEARLYEPTVNTVLTYEISVKAHETVALDGKPSRLLRVVLKPKAIPTNSGEVQLPSKTWWLDGNFVPVRKQFELPGLGQVTLVRTTKESASAPVTVSAKTPDIGVNSLVALDKPIAGADSAKAIRYRIRFEGDIDPASALVQDGHQKVIRVVGKTLDLEVHPVRSPEPVKKPRHPGIEYIVGSRYIDVDELAILKMGERAVGDETDPWKKALLIEQAVRRSMRPDNSAPLVAASKVASTLRGDCRHYSFLSTALCRAEGVPARTAIGLLYVTKKGKPYLGFHMWTEVWVAGHWRGIDGTLGRAGVGAGHVKVTHHSWDKVESLTPMMPLLRVVGKMTASVVRVEQ